MGRIEDAMRRAREGTAADVSPASDVDALACEPFPEEAGGAAVDDEPVHRPRTTSQLFEEDPALLSHLEKGLTGKLVVDRTIAPASREQYRRLSATLLNGQASHGIKVIMVTSAAVGEGKTLTASNLALTFSESYRRRVLLIDADLRRPSVHRVFGTDGSVGLSEALIATSDERLPVRRLSAHLTILPAGRPSQDPMAGLSSERMRRIIREARDAYEWVIVDTPPVGLLSDASLVSSMADGVVLVVRAGVTHYDLVQRATEAVGRSRILGVVLNSVSAEQSPTYYSYRHYYGSSRADR